jgi:hypothetical protein
MGYPEEFHIMDPYGNTVYNRYKARTGYWRNEIRMQNPTL